MNKTAAMNEILSKYLRRNKAVLSIAEIEGILEACIDDDAKRRESLETIMTSETTYKETVSESNNSLKFEVIKVEGSASPAYAKLLSYKPNSKKQSEFKNMLIEALGSNVMSFWVPVYDPSMDKDGNIQFVPGELPALQFSYDELERYAKDNGLSIGSKYQYALFLGTMLLRIMEEGCTEKVAWSGICDNSKELAYYYNPKDQKYDYALTGSHPVAGKCDLGNTFKMLARESGSIWCYIAGGEYSYDSQIYPIARLDRYRMLDVHRYNCVGWFVF